MKKTLLLTTVGLLAFAGSASADTIYYDQFQYVGNQLSGEKPDTVDAGGYGGTQNAVWIAGSQWVAIDTGSNPPTEANTGNAQYVNAFLPFTPKDGYIYTLSASLAGGHDDRVDLGFTQYDSINSDFGSINTIGENPPGINAGPWIQLFYDTQQVSVYPGPGVDNPSNSNLPVATYTVSESIPGPGDNPGVYTITLDTETPGDWTYSVTGPGFSTGTLDFTNGQPTINYVAIGNFDDDGINGAYVDDFKLSTVPEPSTYMLLGLGGLALFLMNRRRAFRMV